MDSSSLLHNGTSTKIIEVFAVFFPFCVTAGYLGSPVCSVHMHTRASTLNPSGGVKAEEKKLTEEKEKRKELTERASILFWCVYQQLS
jgi:hypothetical protein